MSKRAIVPPRNGDGDEVEPMKLGDGQNGLSDLVWPF
jgi:hypothetical protein